MSGCDTLSVAVSRECVSKAAVGELSVCQSGNNIYFAGPPGDNECLTGSEPLTTVPSQLSISVSVITYFSVCVAGPEPTLISFSMTAPAPPPLLLCSSTSSHLLESSLLCSPLACLFCYGPKPLQLKSSLRSLHLFPLMLCLLWCSIYLLKCLLHLQSAVFQFDYHRPYVANRTLSSAHPSGPAPLSCTTTFSTQHLLCGSGSLSTLSVALSLSQLWPPAPLASLQV